MVSKPFRIAISILIPVITHCLSAQECDSIIRFRSLSGHYGFIIPHSEVIRPVSGTDPIGIEVNLARLNSSYRSWCVFSGFWFHGIQAGYYNFQNPDILGGAIVLKLFAEPVILPGDHLMFSVRGGCGFSYHTKIYDEAENPQNKFFCTRISFPIYVSAILRFRLASRVNLIVAGNYNHISNGGIKQPNYGMNFPTVSLGAEYQSEPLPSLKGVFENLTIPAERRWALSFQGLMAYKVVDKTEIYPEKGTVATGFHLKAICQLKAHYALCGGVEYINDRALEELIKRDSTGLDHRRAAVTFGQDFILGKVIFGQHLGFYLYSPYRAMDPLYQIYELRIRISRNMIAGIFMKAHRHDAELMGISLGFQPLKKGQFGFN